MNALVDDEVGVEISGGIGRFHIGLQPSEGIELGRGHIERGQLSGKTLQNRQHLIDGL